MNNQDKTVNFIMPDAAVFMKFWSGIESLSFDDGTVEKIESSSMDLRYVTEQVIKEMERVLKKAGRIELYGDKKSCQTFIRLCKKLDLQYITMRKNEKGFLVCGVKPYLIEITDKREVVGIQIESSPMTLMFRVGHLCRWYSKVKYYQEIANRIEPRIFYACYYFPKDKKQPVTYFLGDGVTSIGNKPENASTMTVPTGKYAVFTVIPGSLKNYTRATLAMKRYAYNSWLKNTSYERLDTGMDIEFYDERSEDFIDGEFEVWIPLADQSAK